MSYGTTIYWKDYVLSFFFFLHPTAGSGALPADSVAHPAPSEALPAGSEAHSALFKTLLASPEALRAASVARFLCGTGPLPTYY